MTALAPSEPTPRKDAAVRDVQARDVAAHADEARDVAAHTPEAREPRDVAAHTTEARKVEARDVAAHTTEARKVEARGVAAHIAEPRGVAAHIAEPRDGAAHTTEARGGAAHTTEARGVAARTAEAAAGAARSVASRSARAAQAALSGIEDGLREAGRTLDEERAAWDRAQDRSALPDLEGRDPMESLAIRLDREADFWRGFAIDRMRPGAARALVIAAALAGVLGGLALAAIGALGELLGASASADHLWAAAGSLGLAVLSSLACAAYLDRTSARARDEALVRADAAERKLHRVAAILALAKSGAHLEALCRF